ncbi:C/H/G cyclin [Stemphylium lycopersici]|uniref:C/H/G cyclin n=1 Tax=Stemphylium lycopersici TaxID=183478 RepID=A0A364MT83_STELY|nr:C/H/G cyclin [Stemphylium lycopersici]
MSSSYWESTQRKFWTFTKQDLALERKRMEDAERNLVNLYPLPDRRHLSIYFSHRKTLENGKTSGHPATGPGHCTSLYTSFNDISKIGECEFSLISEMNSQLILHHPYRSLAELQTQFQLTQEENALAWSIINDHYLTDLPLLHAPHVIAITAMFLAVVLKPIGSQVNAAGMNNALQTLGNARGGQGMQARIQKLVDWLAESNVDIEAVVECTQELISLYEVWESYTDKTCKDQIAKFVKARGLDK